MVSSAGGSVGVVARLFGRGLGRGSAGEVDEDTARTNFYLRANFEEFEADGTAGGFGQTRALKSDTAQGVYQGVGGGGKP